MQNLYNCRINAKKYIDLLEDCLIPFIEENYEENVILHQDVILHQCCYTQCKENTRVQVSIEKFATYKVANFSAHSSNLNRIENLWEIPSRAVAIINITNITLRSWKTL